MFSEILHYDAVPLLGAILWGILHGLTPHGHSWLVLLPFALGGVDARGMLRLALAYGLGMLLVAVAVGALLGTLARAVPEAWHHGIEIGVGGVLVLMGLVFMFRPASVHHTAEHLCDEHCHSDKEQKLVRSGTAWGLFVVGITSMLIPCPTNGWLYLQSAALGSPVTGALLFITYALATSVTIAVVAVMMAKSRALLAPLEARDTRMRIMRISGLIILLTGAWMLWLGTHDHHHGDERGARPAAVWTVGQG
jgi:cytochrome c biogenesis protein CcdA